MAVAPSSRGSHRTTARENQSPLKHLQDELHGEEILVWSRVGVALLLTEVRPSQSDCCIATVVVVMCQY